ncbi:MAG: hypothetical protein WA030_00495 [Candidatus Microsaccharimonas sp.]
MIKKILIGAGIVIVAAGVVFGVMYLISRLQSNSTPEKTTTETVLDHSKDYEACNLLDVSTIKETLGDSAANLQNPEDMGIVSNKATGEGVEDIASDSQICVYAFSSGGTLANGYNSSNAFIIERTVYSNEAGPKTLIEQIKAHSIGTTVDTLGDFAFYGANNTGTGPDAAYSFKLEVFIDKVSVKYMIRQPADSASFTDESAKTALVKLARLAKQP